MRLWGKFFGVGIGFMFGKFAGALLGLVIGHWWDTRGGKLKAIRRRGTNRQAVFFNSTFAVMGHVAKASGRVTEDDIRLASLVMDQMRLTGDARRDAQQAFRDGKAADFDLKGCLRAFRLLTLGRPELLQMFLEIQIQTALADGELQPKEQKILQVIATELGFKASQLNELLSRWQAEFRFRQSGGTQVQPIEQAYKVLGIAASAADQDVKRAYRKLMNEHHPDKLVAKGLPPEMMELAKQTAQDVQRAYDRIKAERGMR
ncbi:co-chaperone DjlA [Shewanella sp. GXUN23E]|uniref:co-chaperone DjlA n=1 Tax=Shewanella sp. GXUN23E TaxID=3422498 RepID=UPI003D7CF861